MTAIQFKVREANNQIIVKTVKQPVNQVKVQVSQNIAKVKAVVAGPRGPKGDVGSDKHYETSFSVASSVNVNHNLGKLPAVTVIDSANDQVEGDVTYVDANNLVVSFDSPFSGKVLCN